MPLTFLPPVPTRPASAIPRPIHRRLSMTATNPPRTAQTYTPENAIRPALRSMAPYTPILPYEILAQNLNRKPADIVKLDANENPYGPAPSVADALANAPYMHIYPDPASLFLREALEEYTSVRKDYLLAGAGADELIDLLFRLFVIPGAGESVVNCPPTFGMYKFDADVNGAELINVPRDEATFAINVDAVERVFAERGEGRYPKLVFVASPNNPDGSILSDDQLKRLLALPTVVVVDEAYFEFADDNRIIWVPQYDNLVVLRTFSKWAGLAGLRIGYGAFPLPIIKHLWKVKQPYNVSVAAQVAGIVSIKQKDDLLKKVNKMVAQRHAFYERVAKYPWLFPYPSQSNYVLCRVGNGKNAADVKAQLANRGILIRYYTSKGLSDCIRISMGTPQQMERLYNALDEL